MSRAIEPQLIGEHIRRLRLKRHVSVRTFAAQTGFSPSFISQLENGLVSPSLGSLQKIAEALGVTLGDFFAGTESTKSDERLVVKRSERRRLDSTWTDAHLESVGPTTRGRRLEPVVAIFGPGGQSGKHVHSQSREAFAFVLRGTVTLTLADEQNELSPGDSVTIPAHSPHRWANEGDEPVEILLVSSRIQG
jgi:quercetin dioxygenase-like cupin family protein/DNA-binding Xre family transcriptional regulator